MQVDKKVIENYFKEVTSSLNLRMYGSPIIFSPGGEGKEENQGYDAFVPLIDSGISLYIWTKKKFLSCVLYTCKDFSTPIAIEFTRSFFKTTELEFEEF